MISKAIDFKTRPILSGLLCGIGVAITIILIAFIVAIYFVVLEKSTGDVGGAGGLIGFIILPLLILLGAPWSIFIFGVDDFQSMVTGIVIGLFLNGLFIGFIYGLYRKIRNL